MTITTDLHCAECGASITSCETKMWLGSEPCCDGCNHQPGGEGGGPNT